MSIDGNRESVVLSLDGGTSRSENLLAEEEL